MKGRFHLSALEYEKGRNYFQELIEEDPSYHEAWLFLGLSYFLENNFNDAIKNLNRSIELRPHSYRALMILGGALYYLEKYDEAIEKIDEFVLNVPGVYEQDLVKVLSNFNILLSEMTETDYASDQIIARLKEFGVEQMSDEEVWLEEEEEILDYF